MKKIVALLLALMMLCSMAACGAKGESAEPSNTASSEAAEVQQPEQTTGEVNSAPAAQEASAEASASENAPEATISYPVAEPVTLTALDAIYQPRTADKITSWSESLQYLHRSDGCCGQQPRGSVVFRGHRFGQGYLERECGQCLEDPRCLQHDCR